MEDKALSETVMDWSTTFIRLSLHDFNRYIRMAGLSLGQMTVLMHLHFRGPTEVTHFCDMMQVTPAGASQMIERMVKQGMVERIESPTDRRVRLVNLTNQGRDIVLESITARQEWISQLIESLSTEERDQISAALTTLNHHAKKLSSDIP